MLFLFIPPIATVGRFILLAKNFSSFNEQLTVTSFVLVWKTLPKET